MRLKWGLIFLGLLLLIFAVYSYVYKKHRDISTENGIPVNSVENLFEEFKKNEADANELYLDKVIQVKGKITQVDSVQNTVVIDEKLFSSFQKNDFKNNKLNSNVIIKGRFIGYDDLLEELKMDNCLIIE